MTTAASIKGDISSIFEQIEALKKEGGEDLVCFAKINGFKITRARAVVILGDAVALRQKMNLAWLLRRISFESQRK